MNKKMKFVLMSTVLLGFTGLALTGCDKVPSFSSGEVNLETPEVVEVAPEPAKREIVNPEDEVGFGKNVGLVDSDDTRHDFENFYKSGDGITIVRNTTPNAEGKYVVDELSMDYNRYIGLYRTNVDVEPGSVFEAAATLWTEAGVTASVVLQISNFCTSENPEVTSETVVLTDMPQTIKLSHTFANAHGCILFRVTNVQTGGAKIYGAGLSLYPL